LYIIRGLPGSGKSTFAAEVAAALSCLRFEADMFHMDEDGNYNWKPENVHAAHQWCQAEVQAEMVTGRDVIVSNTFTTEKELKPYLQLAKMLDYRVVSLIVENRHGNESIHNVPEETMQKMQDRFSVKLRGAE
jgi:predicted kinase